jgi:hypothetical protein
MRTPILIEDGMLLKPYVRPWKPGGWDPAPPGWTAYRTDEVVTEGERIVVEEGIPFEMALQRAALEDGKRRKEAHHPWPGWVPISVARDRGILKAFQALVREMGSYPPDGKYQINDGVMEQVV